MTTTRSDYFRLDFVTGWCEEKREHLILTPGDGHLRLPPLIGRGRQVVLGGRPACVRAMVVGSCGALFLLDAGRNLIRRKRSPEAPLERLPNIGDDLGIGGSRPRELRNPRGIAVQNDGTLIVADTGNNRLQLFHPDLWPLIAMWEGFAAPWSVVAGGALIYVSECNAHRIQILNSRGERQATWSHPLLHQPTQMVLDSKGHLAVITPGNLFLFDPDGTASVLLKDVTDPLIQPTALAFDHLDRLHVGTRGGLLWQFAPGADGKFELLGTSVSGIAGCIDAVVEWPTAKKDASAELLLAILREGDRRTTFWRASTEGACGERGTFVSMPLDSRIAKCTWHRLVLQGDIPAGSSISIYTQTVEAEPKDTPAADFPAQPAYRAIGPLQNPDCLVQSAPGRLLRFKLVFQSNGLRSPDIRAVHVEFPRNSYLRFLPSVYQDNQESRQFLDRFLALFQTAVNEENLAVDQLHQLFDARTVPAKHLRWLASWLAFPLNPDWSEAYQRQQLDNAFDYYLKRGTRLGLEEAIKNFAQVDFARIMEHFRLRQIPDLCAGASLERGQPLWSPRIYSRWQIGAQSTLGQVRVLDGPEPAIEPFALYAHQFSVFFPANPACPDDTVRRIARVVSAEKPAHTQATLCAVYPRFRVGVQSRIGVDSMIGMVSFMMLSGAGQKRLSRLGYDSVLNPSAPPNIFDGHLPAATPVALGHTSQLL